MNKLTLKQLILIVLIALCFFGAILVAPFSMKIADQASSYQKIAATHGEDLPLFTAISALPGTEEKINEWHVVTGSAEHNTLMNIVSDYEASQVNIYYIRLICFFAAIIGLIVCVILLKKGKLLLLSVGAIIMVFPFYWMLISSLKTSSEMNLFPPTFVPANWLNFENYAIAWEAVPFGTYFVNSIIVCVGSVCCVMFTTILAAYAFARLKFPGRDALFTLLLSMMMVPFELLVITNYQTITRLGLRNERLGLIIPFTSSIFYTYILRNFFVSVPDSLYSAATVDGCSNWQYLWKVMVPMAKPSLVTVLLLNAMASWNSFMWPQLVSNTDASRTLPWALIHFTTEVGAHNEQIMAGATFVILPMLILFLVARKQIVAGVSRGGIKG